MTVLNLQINASGNDGDQNTSGISGNITRTELRFGNDSNAKIAGMRSLNVTIAQGTSITTATLTVTWSFTYSTGSTIQGNIYGDDADNSAIFTTTNNNISGRALTTAVVASGSINNVVLNATKAWTVTSVVQEIIDRAGFASGNALSILFKDNGSTGSEWQEIFSYDGSTTKAAKLDITYSSGITGQASVTLGALTTTATGALPIVGQASITLDALTVSATATLPITGQASITLGALTTTATGALPIAGQASITLEALTTTATGALPIVGQASITLDALTTTATGVLGGAEILGQADITLGALTTTATGTLPIAGQASITLGALTVVADGTLPVGEKGDVMVRAQAYQIAQSAECYQMAMTERAYMALIVDHDYPVRMDERLVDVVVITEK